MNGHQAFEFDHWFNSDQTLPIDGEPVWVRDPGGTIRAAIFTNDPFNSFPFMPDCRFRGKFAIEGDAGSMDMYGLVFWQPRTTVIL